jgi:hypothetical protein
LGEISIQGVRVVDANVDLLVFLVVDVLFWIVLNEDSDIVPSVIEFIDLI